MEKVSYWSNDLGQPVVSRADGEIHGLKGCRASKAKGIFYKLPGHGAKRYLGKL